METYIRLFRCIQPWLNRQYNRMGISGTQPEGFITGTATKLFRVEGPVLVFGISASVIYGLILVLLQGV